VNRLLRNRTIGGLAAIAVVAGSVVGVSSATAAPEDKSLSAAAQLVDDKALLTGVLFATGEYADKIGINVHEVGQKLPAEYDAIAGRAVDAYYAANAPAADAAIELIRSGDILTAKEGLRLLVDDFSPWVKSQVKKGSSELAASGVATPQAAVCVWNVCAANLALFINVAVAVAVWLVTFVIDDNQSGARAASEDQFLARLTDAAVQ